MGMVIRVIAGKVDLEYSYDNSARITPDHLREAADLLERIEAEMEATRGSADAQEREDIKEATIYE
jgi:hypothetical protein